MKNFFDSAMEILCKARDKAGTVTKLAEQAGINQVTLGRWFSGERKPSAVELGKVFDYLGVTLAEPGIDRDEYECIPKVKARAGAGSSLVTDEKVMGYYAFKQSFLCRENIHARQSVLLEVMGESMQPLIMNGDTILVDQSRKELQDGKIFLVGFGDELLVKRLHRSPRGWLLVSQNPDYAPIPVEGADLELLRVYGRVRWFGRVV